jgi:cardiolipin synthase
MENKQINAIKQKAIEAEKARKPKTIEAPTTYDFKNHRMRTRTIVVGNGKEANSFKRIFIIAAAILLEIAALAFFYTQFIMAFLWVLFIPFGFGVIFACRVAVNKKNSDSKIAWILFLLIMAPVAVFVYLLAGEAAATPLRARKMKRINKKTKLLPKAEIPDDLPARVKQDCNYIQNTSDYTPFFGGAAEYFPMGEDFFEDVLTRIKKAEKFIFMDFFILEEGHLAAALFEVLAERARAGVDVRIIVDGLGSHGTLSLPKVNRIRKSGIKIIAFAPIIPIVNFFMNYRNHRKIIVIDGHTGYVGGTNIADEYINAKQRFGTWKDASLRIEGNAVKSLTLTFLRMWEYSSKDTPDYERFLNAEETKDDGGGAVIIPYADGPSEKNKLGKEVYGTIIANAQKSLYIMTPYFIIDNYLVDMLKAKARSGVDVRLIIPGIPDKKMVYSLSRSNAERLTESGVRVYAYTPGFLHSKVMLSDDECAVVGSINMDFRSFYQQYESAAYIAGTNTVASIAQDFENTFSESYEIRAEDVKKRNIAVRFWLSFLRLFAPMM